MPRKVEEQKLAVAEQVAKIFATIMVVLFISIGTTIIFKAPEMQNEQYGRIGGVVLICYGILRGYRVYRKYYSNQHHDS